MFLLKVKLQYHSETAFSSVGVHILSAVRTPIGLLNGTLNEISAPQLCSFTFKEALQRAVVPCKDFQNIFLSCNSHTNCTNEIIRRTGLSKTLKVSSSSLFGMNSFIKAIKSLVMANKMVSLAGGVDFASNLPSALNQEYLCNVKNMQEVIQKVLKNNSLNLGDLRKYAEQDYKKFLEATKKGAFIDEIIKINFIKKGQQILVEGDEVATFPFSTCENSELNYSPPFANGAVAIVISTEDYIQNNQLTPLAEIISFSEVPAEENDFASAQVMAIEKVLKLANCNSKEISRWETDSAFGVFFNCINHFKIESSLVNKDGGMFTLGYPVGLSGMKAVCHLIHSLNDGELGCAVTSSLDGSASAVIIKKKCSTSSRKPQLVLYTKSVCPLCEELKEGLKVFEGRFSLNEIDIEAEENKTYYELFKYEIPVLFLDGRFLCKHKLDAQQLSRRLAVYENVT